MAVFLDFDPLTGVEQWVDDDEGRLQVHYRQDVEPILDLARMERNDEDITKRGIKNDFWLYARVPTVVILELRHKGIDIFKDTRRAFKEINENYPHLKTTTKHHGYRRA